MNLHKHARLSPRGRALLVDRILSVRTAYKWLKRFCLEGAGGLLDRSSR